METGHKFGDYVLFKRLSEDAFGESFRAGRVGARGIERVVLLRLFNRAEIDRQELSRLLSERQGVQAILKSPHLGEGVGLGSEGGIPYVTYEYLSGKSLRQLQDQARDKPFPIPVEHALFITERIALGLAAAHDTRFQGERLIHGFLTPGWVWLSSEGEVRLLGIDVASGLRSLPDSVRRDSALLPYLAPEVAAGDSPLASDDVYSLGAILYELLTGAQVPVDDRQAALESAVLASEGSPVPPDLRQLIAQSLGPRNQRTPTVDKWRATLSNLISAGDYSPTTFNLAFFLHTLFRGEIDQESQEIEREKAGEVTPAQPTQPAAAAVPEESFLEIAEPGAGAEEELTPSPSSRLAGVARASEDDGKKKVIAIGAAAAVVVAALAAGGYYYYSRVDRDAVTAAPGDQATTPVAVDEAQTVPGGLPDDGSGLDPSLPAATTEEGAEQTAEGSEPPVAATEAPPATRGGVDLAGAEPPPTPEELERRVAQLVARGVGEMESSLKSDYEARLEELRTQLEEARQAAAAAAASESEQKPPPELATQEVTKSPTGGPAATGGAQNAAAGGASSQPAPAQPQTGARTGAAATGRQPAEAAQQAAAEEPEPEPVQRGDLVTPGAGVKPPEIVNSPRPVYPPAARKFAKTATVKLRVLVDENGKPSKVERLSESARYGFDEAAERAARGTAWKPATKDGVAVKMWVELTIDFRP